MPKRLTCAYKVAKLIGEHGLSEVSAAVAMAVALAKNAEPKAERKPRAVKTAEPKPAA
jgi:hypothetical protein